MGSTRSTEDVGDLRPWCTFSHLMLGKDTRHMDKLLEEFIYYCLKLSIDFYKIHTLSYIFR